MVGVDEETLGGGEAKGPVAEGRAGPQLSTWRSIDGIPWWQFGLRILWVALQIALIFNLILAHQKGTFFYQGF